MYPIYLLCKKILQNTTLVHDIPCFISSERRYIFRGVLFCVVQGKVAGVMQYVKHFN